MNAVQAITSILLCLLLSCSASKEHVHEREAMRISEQAAVNKELRYQRLGHKAFSGIRLEAVGTVTEIAPVGTFRFSIDSGFIGEAKMVVVQQGMQRLQAVEANAVEADAGEELALETRHEESTIERNMEEDRRMRETPQPLDIPWWVWLSVVTAGGYALRQVFRR